MADDYPDMTGSLNVLMDFARQDDCFRHFVPSDIRQLIGRCARAETRLLECAIHRDRERAECERLREAVLEGYRSLRLAREAGVWDSKALPVLRAVLPGDPDSDRRVAPASEGDA